MIDFHSKPKLLNYPNNFCLCQNLSLIAINSLEHSVILATQSYQVDKAPKLIFISALFIGFCDCGQVLILLILVRMISLVYFLSANMTITWTPHILLNLGLQTRAYACQVNFLATKMQPVLFHSIVIDANTNLKIPRQK